MSWAALPALLLVVAVQDKPIPAGPQQKPAATETRPEPSPIAIVCDVDLARIQTRALAVARETWKQACTLYGVDPKPPPKPLEFHLYRKVADYEAACDRLVHGDLKRNWAFTEWSTFSAHVVLQPLLEGDAFQRLVPTWMTLRLVAHESAHMARFSKVENFHSHPDWFCDGSASWLETKVLASQGRLATPEQSSEFSTEDLLVQRLVAQNRIPSVDDLVHDRTDGVQFLERYAVRWLFFRFLVEGRHAKQFHTFVADLGALDETKDFTERATVALEKRLGPDVWKSLDQEFQAWIRTLAPEWDEPVPSLEVVGDEWIQVAFDDANAVAFRTAPAGAKTYAIEGSVTAFADRWKAPQMNLLIGREQLDGDHNRFVSLAIVPGVGATLFDFDSSLAEAQQWKRLGGADEHDTVLAKPVPFRVDCTPKDGKTIVSVQLAGKKAIEATVERVLSGPFGVGAQHGSSGVWHGVKLVQLSR